MTPRQEKIIREKFETHTYKELAAILGVSVTTIGRYCAKCGLYRVPPKQEVLDRIAVISEMRGTYSNGMIAKKLGISLQKVKRAINTGRLESRKPGSRALIELPNSGRFLPGQTPQNVHRVGKVSVINQKDCPRYRIKQEKGFRYVHDVIWEKHNGPRKKGTVLRFIDGNYRNLAIDNLDEVPKSIHLYINGKVKYGTPELYQLARLVAELKLKSNQIFKS